MHRNLDRRVEALVQVTDPTACAELDRMLAMSMSDDTEGFELRGDGTWIRRVSTAERPLTHLQSALLRRVVGGTA
jgi:polyphosphate kinase